MALTITIQEHFEIIAGELLVKLAITILAAAVMEDVAQQMDANAEVAMSWMRRQNEECLFC